MAKRAPQMTSSDAIGSFKAKITESLPLLGFLNNEDKCDVWRFWKTVSSAVKIAVNGKGDIVETQRRHYKSAKYIRERQLEGYGIPHIDRGAITIYVPVKCSDKGLRKFRVLKIANHKKISDYYETFPVLEGEALDTPLPDADLENIDISSLSNNLDVSKVERDLCDKVTSNSIASDEELSAVVRFLQETQTKNSIQESKVSLQGADIKRDSCKSDMDKPVRKIWPVGRPTTRSLGVRLIRDQYCESEDTKRHIKKAKCETDDVSSITFYPSVKEEVRESVDEDFDITIVPVGTGVMQITKSTLSGFKEHIHDSQEILNQQLAVSHLAGSTLNSEESIFHQSMHAENTLTDYQVVLPEMSHADSGVTDSDKHCLIAQGEIHPDMEDLNSTPVYDTSVSQPKHEQTGQSKLTPRNASDIETIISALEAELKKTVTGVNSEPNVKDNTTPEEVMVSDVQADFDETSVQTVQMLEGEEIVDVQHMGNVIWTPEGEVQIIGSNHVVDSAASNEGAVVFEGQPVEPQYDVVEYEVLADKKLKRGRKKKVKEENSEEKSEVVDRTCPICHTVLNYASSMTAHMRIHTGVRPYSCGQCDRSFTTKANRDRHEATHVGLKPFQCNQCNKSFTEKRSLKIHMRSHTGERPFVCSVCGRGFAQKCTLLIHMDRHTNKKGHLCDLCGKAFRQKSQLDVHVKRHKRQASYPCNECSTKCYTRGDLMRHMIKHTGERPYRCELCNRAFTRKQYLIDHENQHYGRKPYRCSVCSATFHDMGSCHRHLRKHKQDEEGENSKGPTKSALLSSTDFDMILEGTQIGQILKLDDGTEALVKAVTAEADGSTVYHITCIGKLPTMSVTNASEPLEEAAQQDRGMEASN